MPRFLDQRQLSEMLAVPVRTLERWRFERRGPRFRKMAGKLVRYELGSVLEWIEQQEGGGGER